MQTFIKNRLGQNVCVVVEGEDADGGLVFVMHGLGSNKDKKHIRVIAETFLEKGYTVVSFDTTNTFGKSDGAYEDSTVTNYYSDLEDVIAWAKLQTWYREPFVLAGHSLGGISVALFAEKYPDKVRALLPLAPVVSGKLSVETYSLFPQLESLEEWKRTGVRITKSRDGTFEKRLKWSHMEDRLKYDLIPEARKLTMPVLIVVGEKDDRTPPVHQEILFKALSGKKQLHVIPGSDHSFSRAEDREDLKGVISNWLNTI